MTASQIIKATKANEVSYINYIGYESNEVKETERYDNRRQFCKTIREIAVLEGGEINAHILGTAVWVK